MSNLGKIGKPIDPDDAVLRGLVLALERARSRLAVIVALEGKAALLWHWKRYMETDLRMRRYLKSLRNGLLEDLRRSESWAAAMKDLERLLAQRPLYVHGLTIRYCGQLAQVLETLEQPCLRKE